MLNPATSDLLIRGLLGTLPVLLFLLSLIYLDSYKLVRASSVIAVIAAGAGAAVAGFWINTWLLSHWNLETSYYSRYGAPVVEELLKAAVLVFLIRLRRVGFLVDAAIYGFAVGTGFAVIENLYYLKALDQTHLAVWAIRGLGTATMHGGTSALFAIVSKLLSEIKATSRMMVFLPGLLAAITVHSFHNHLAFTQPVSTAGILLVFPTLVTLVFRRSERTLQHWLGLGMDADTELLALLNSGRFSDSRIGKYLESLRRNFSGQALGDMLSYLRIQTELAIRAKGAFLMREAGFPVEPDPEIREKLEEIRYLERQIGRTGKQAIAPFIHVRSHDLWQLDQLIRHGS